MILRKSVILVIVSLVLSLAYIGTLQAKNERRVVTYKDLYTSKNKGSYYKDNNLWIYTSKFAKRFGMPEEWIDDSLEGAAAVAFRVVESPFENCGLFGEKENCRKNRNCYWDVYLDAEDSNKLNWPDDGQRRYRKLNGGRSDQFLIKQRKEDSRNWNPITQKIEFDKNEAQVLSWNALVSGDPIYRQGKLHKPYSNSTGISGIGYAREYVPNLDVMYFFACPFRSTKTKMRIEFKPSKPIKRYVTYEKNMAELKKLREQGRTKYHVVSFPDSYTAQVMKLTEERKYGAGSLINEVRKRLELK